MNEKLPTHKEVTPMMLSEPYVQATQKQCSTKEFAKFLSESHSVHELTLPWDGPGNCRQL